MIFDRFAHMHNDYLDPDKYLNNEVTPEERDAIIAGLAEHDTGRWYYEKIHCCLTGKDADLETWGQQGIEVLDITNDGNRISCLAHIGKTFVGTDVCLNLPDDAPEQEYEKARQDYLEIAHEIVSQLGMSGDWSGDDWYVFDELLFEVDIVWTTDEFINIEKTAQAIIDKANAVLTPIVEKLECAHKACNEAAGYKEGRESRD